MTAQRAEPARYLVVRPTDRLVAVPVDENGEEVTYYFADEATADAVLPDTTAEALAAVGAWSDLDWNEMIESLDRIRHESKPTPPIDDLDDL